MGAKENCRRKFLLEGVGGKLHTSYDRCCDVCNTNTRTKINFFEHATVSQRKRRRAVRRVSDDNMKLLRTRLFDERTAFLNEHPGLGMIGSTFVCSDVTIEEICAQAKFINTVDISLFGVRHQLKDRFFNIISDICGDISCNKRFRQ